MATMTADTDDFHYVTVKASYETGVSITTTSGARTVWADGPSLIGAVQKELGIPAVPEGMRLVPADAIVIERGELPVVEPSPDHSNQMLVGGRIFHTDPIPELSAAARRTLALQNLALAEYLDAHPPVDEEQVEAFRSLVAEATVGLSWPERDAIARRLVEAGVRTPEATA